MSRHVHADLIVAWANGAEVQTMNPKGEWVACTNPQWGDKARYRLAVEEGWAENIPPQGILCLVRDHEADKGDVRVVVNKEAGSYYPYSTATGTFRFAKPLTLEEILPLVYKPLDT